MIPADATGLLVGAIALGAVHGIEPGHGWPVAASYALDKSNKWVYGLAASSIIGIGHLVSSIAMVLMFFYAKSYFGLAEVNEPISLAPGLQIGGPVSLVAGVLLIGLGIREYRHGHSHSHGDDQGDGHPRGDGHGNGHGHEHGHGIDHEDGNGEGHEHLHERGQGPGHGHSHDHDYEHTHGKLHEHSHDLTDTDSADIRSRISRAIKSVVPFVGGGEHDHRSAASAADRGLLGIAWFAFVLGFAHEEEFEIIALCAGSNYCLSLMSAYALTVILGIVGFTLLLIAGYQHYEDRVRAYTPYLPVFSAFVLVVMGLGFISGLF